MKYVGNIFTDKIVTSIAISNWCGIHYCGAEYCPIDCQRFK